jgi:hypothetical protein
MAKRSSGAHPQSHYSHHETTHDGGSRGQLSGHGEMVSKQPMDRHDSDKQDEALSKKPGDHEVPEHRTKGAVRDEKKSDHSAGKAAGDGGSKAAS